jgi:hypothetical protein
MKDEPGLKKPELKIMLDKISEMTFKRALSETLAKKICINCLKKVNKFKNRRNQSLYRLDGLCDDCRRKFDLK